jgi:hypothetical protein
MMWARVVEIMLGCWLAISPFVFDHPVENSAWWINDLCSGFAVATLALLSFWTPLRHAHFGLLLVALWLIGFAYLALPYPTPPALQNDLIIGTAAPDVCHYPKRSLASTAEMERCPDKGTLKNTFGQDSES